MSKRKNDGKFNEESKQKKSDDVDLNAPASVDVHNQETSPAIFKLNAICCDDMFEWLSIEDLHSLGQTCKRMHRLTGLYFKENFKLRINCKDQSIYNHGLQLNGFIQFVTSIEVIDQNMADFQYIGANCDSLRHIIFYNSRLTKTLIDCIKVKLDKIEKISLYDTSLSLNLYDDFLKLCPNLKILHVSEVKGSDWMCHKYPKLEKLDLIFRQETQCPNLGRFFQENPHLKRFRTTQPFLSTNRDIFMNFGMKLDVLDVFCDHFDSIYTSLNELYNRGFYKRLELGGICKKTAEPQKYQIDTLLGLEALYGGFETKIVFPKTVNLKELGMSWITGGVDLGKVTTSFPNLRKVHLWAASIDEFLLFIRRLPQLKELSIDSFQPLIYQLDLSILNKERKRFSGACKVDIYVPEKVYLVTKEASGNIYANHDLIEIKRVN